MVLLFSLLNAKKWMRKIQRFQKKKMDATMKTHLEASALKQIGCRKNESLIMTFTKSLHPGQGVNLTESIQILIECNFSKIFQATKRANPFLRLLGVKSTKYTLFRE